MFHVSSYKPVTAAVKNYQKRERHVDQAGTDVHGSLRPLIWLAGDRSIAKTDGWTLEAPEGRTVMGVRRDRKDRILANQQQSRIDNGHLKRAERVRRDSRYKGLVEKGKLPFTPPVLSWLSGKLDKPGRLITQTDVDKFLKG